MSYGLILMAVVAAIGVGQWIGAYEERERIPAKSLPEYRQGKDIRIHTLLDIHFPLWLIGFNLVTVAIAGGFSVVLQTLVDLMVPATVYFAVLLLLLPLLRRTISARGCGFLWLLPLFWGQFVFILYEDLGNVIPKVLIYVPKTVWSIFIAVWLTGFIATVIWFFFGHFSFRKQLETGAKDVEPTVEMLWWEEQDRADWNERIPLKISPLIQTPLVIGIRKKGLRAYLPQRSYDETEYRLIFRHELRHILRKDSCTKMYWAIFCAFCWFNPLVWIASRRAAEDLELSCDAFVLEGETGDVRHRYAELLLETAADDRGFSTCLSAEAKTLRYRLKCVVAPKKLYSGALVLSAAMVALVLGSGLASFTTEKGTIGELYPLSHMEADWINYRNLSQMYGRTWVLDEEFQFGEWEGETHELLRDREGLLNYLESLPVTRLPDRLARNDFEVGGYHVSMRLVEADGSRAYYLNLSESYFTVSWYTGVGARMENRAYRIDQPLDWEYILSNLIFEDTVKAPSNDGAFTV